MANDCLVTKLKSVVDNDNLLPLGFIRIELDCTAGNLFSFTMRCKEAQTIKLAGNAFFSDSAGTVDVNNKTLLVPANYRAVVYIKNTVTEHTYLYISVYSLDVFNVRSAGNNISLKIEDFKYATELLEFGGENFVGSDDFCGSLSDTVTTVECTDGNNLKATTTGLKKFVNAETLFLGGVVISGDITELSSLPMLMNLRVNNESNENTVYGELNELFQNRIEGGISNNLNLRVAASKTRLTLNGSRPANNNISFSYISSTSYSVTCNNVTYNYVKNGDNWELQS